MAKIYGRVYCITSLVSGKKYVGTTRKTAEKRFRGHIKISRRRVSHNLLDLHRDIFKFGAWTFALQELETVESEKALHNRERSWIARLKTLAPLGYNLHPGGKGGPLHPYSIKRMQDFHRAPSARAKSAANTTAIWANPVIRAKMVAALRRSGKQAIRRKHMSEAKKSTWAGPGYKEKLAIAMVQPQVIERMRKASKRNWESPAYREKVAFAKRAQWNKPGVRKKRTQAIRDGIKRAKERRDATAV